MDDRVLGFSPNLSKTPIPGGLVIAAGVVFHGGWAVVAPVTLRIEIASHRERHTLIAMG